MQAEPVHSDDRLDEDVFVAPKQQAGKKKRDVSGPPRQKKFIWRKYPDATAFLCTIKPQLLDSCLRQHEKTELKETTAEDLLKWWRGYEQDGRNQGDMREIIHQFYKNRLQFKDWHKYEQAETSNATPDPSSARDSVSEPSTTPAITLDPESDDLRALLAPLLKHIQGRARGASVLWAEAHAARVKERKILLGGGRGTHQRAIGQLFNGLDAEEQAEWQERAHAEKAALLDDPDLCFKNQEGFPSLIAQLLSSFIGFGPKQVGLALFEVVMAIRCKDGTIQRDRITVGVTKEQETFGEYDGGPSQREINRWNGYVDEYLPHNPIARDPRLQYPLDGRPRLPPFERTWSLDEVANILDVWFVSLWHYNREHDHSTLPHGLDWDVVAKSPAEYIPTAWLDKEVQRPADIDFFQLPTVYQRFFKAQDSPDQFRWIHKPLTGEQLPPPIAAPVTPVKTTRILYSSPTRKTPPAPFDIAETTGIQTPATTSRHLYAKSALKDSTPAHPNPSQLDATSVSVSPPRVATPQCTSPSPVDGQGLVDGQDSVLASSPQACATPPRVLDASTLACTTSFRDSTPLSATPPPVTRQAPVHANSSPACATPPRVLDASTMPSTTSSCVATPRCASPPRADGQDSLRASSALLPLDRQDPNLARSTLVCATPLHDTTLVVLAPTCATPPHLPGQDPALIASTLSYATPPSADGQDPFVVASTPLTRATPHLASSALPCVDRQDPPVIDSAPVCAMPTLASGLGHAIARSAPACATPPRDATVVVLTPTGATLPHLAGQEPALVTVVSTLPCMNPPRVAGQDPALVASTPACATRPGVDEQDPAPIHSVPVCATLSHADGLDPALMRSTPACGLNHSTAIPTDAPVDGSGANQVTEPTGALSLMLAPPLLHQPSLLTTDTSPEGSALLVGQKRSATLALGIDVVSQREPKKRCRKPPPVAPSTRVLRGRNATASTSDAMAKKAPENRG